VRVIKPNELSMQLRPFHFDGKQQLALGVLIAHPLDATQPAYSEQDLWALASTYLKDWDVFDEGMPKAFAEYLVYGHYYSAQPVSADNVQVQVGSLHKTLIVTGQREWRKLTGSTDPKPLVELPLSYEFAYGGEGVLENPVGIGAEGVWLPQIEHPDYRFSHPKTHVTPAGFTARSIEWLPRKNQWGTYNSRWEQTDAPGFARDIKWEIFQLAPEDQWLKDPAWQGGEVIKVLKLHRTQTVQEGTLPQLRIRLFVTKGGELFELPNKFETVWLFPNETAQVAAYRAQVALDTFDGSEIDAVLIAYEHASQEKKSTEHYAGALEKRLQPEGDIDDPEDLALRPDNRSLTELNPVAPSEKDELELPGAGGVLGLGALAVLAKMKGGKGGSGAEAAGTAEAKVDEAAAPEVAAGGAGAEGGETEPVDAEAAARAEAKKAAKEEQDEAAAESMAAMNELLDLMSDDAAKVSEINKATLDALGIPPDLMANLSTDSGVNSLLDTALPKGAPKAAQLNDPSALGELLKAPAELAKKAEAAGLDSAAFGDNKAVIESILAGEPLTEGQSEKLLSDSVLRELGDMAKKADMENAVDPRVMDAINKSSTPKK